MALYELSGKQVEGILEIIGNAMIPGRAAAQVAGIQRALQMPTVVMGQQQGQESTEGGEIESTEE
jgi:hypothetical protein